MILSVKKYCEEIPSVKPEKDKLSLIRNLKLGLFHLGSGIADVITTGVWNRIMISDFGLSATPVAFLLSLRYFLIPIGIWSGEMSDRRRLLGTRRLVWIWSGRLLMLIGLLLTGWQTSEISQKLLHSNSEGITRNDWLVFAFALLLFSFGNALSGSTFLALLYDRAPQKQRGQVVGIVWAFLLLGFMLAGILFGILLPEGTENAQILSPSTIRSLFVATSAIVAILWFVSIVGEERKSRTDRSSANTTLRKGRYHPDLKLIWDQPKLRYFVYFLICSFIFAFLQDIVLEPFAGDVLAISTEKTARFSAYWGGMSILSTVIALYVIRKFENIQHAMLASWGTLLLTLAIGLFAIIAFTDANWLLIPGLLIMGFGLGLWNVGTLGLMMDFSPSDRAGTFMGIWTVVITLSRGTGVFAGGVLRDLLHFLGLTLAGSYGALFLIEAMGLTASWLLLGQVKEQLRITHYSSNPAKVGLSELAESLES